VLLAVLDLIFSFGSILLDPMKLHFGETILMRCIEAKSRIGSALLIIHDTPLAGYRPYPSTP
jgi:hypothetical protein